jgi:hypothetical protein
MALTGTMCWQGVFVAVKWCKSLSTPNEPQNIIETPFGISSKDKFGQGFP